MPDHEPKSYKNFRWIVADPDLLGGKPTLRGTRFSVSLILECLSAGMPLEEINESFASDISARDDCRGVERWRAACGQALCGCMTPSLALLLTC
jgi:uncharacterized protein (DUF433 family)